VIVPCLAVGLGERVGLVQRGSGHATTIENM
jgi:hypothetical protein